MKPGTVQELFTYYAKLRLASINDVHEDDFAERVTGCDEIDGKFTETNTECDEIDGVMEKESKQKKAILDVARKLIKLTEEFEKTHLSHSDLHNNKVQGGVSLESTDVPEEDQSSVVSKILDRLSGTVTPETFKEAIQSICVHATSVPLELALAFELSAQICKAFQQNLNFIPQILEEQFHSRIDIEDIQDSETDNADD